METIKIMGGQEYLVSDEESEYLKKIVLEGKVKFITLSSGDMVNISSISKIGSLDKVKSWGGYILRNDGRSFVRDGEVVYLNGNDDIEEIEDPKYKQMAIISIKQLQ